MLINKTFMYLPSGMDGNRQKGKNVENKNIENRNYTNIESQKQSK